MLDIYGLIWNKQTNFNKFGPLSENFQRVLKVRKMRNFPWENFLLPGGNLTRSDFDHSNLSKPKNNIL